MPWRKSANDRADSNLRNGPRHVTATGFQFDHGQSVDLSRWMRETSAFSPAAYTDSRNQRNGMPVVKHASSLTMNPNRHRFGAMFALCLATLFLSITTPGTAQAQKRNPASSLPAMVPPIMLGRMLVGGQGMAILQLGASFQQVLQDFGPPAKVDRSGLMGKVQNWLYRADDGTDIIVIGEKSVDAISLRGPRDSTFMTMEGVGFGTDRGIVLTHYGRPKVSDKGKRWDYPQLGITFDLTNKGVVDVISIDKIEN